jgi:urease accessory protein
MMKCDKRIMNIFRGALLMVLIPGIAGAHGNAGDSGFVSGLNHPVFGFDHLLAMVTVGLLSAQMGGRAIWTVPATFVTVMSVGGILGMKGIRLPMVELWIAFSVLALGSALAAAKKLPVSVAMGFVGFFALFHGHAHGTEMPRLAEPAMYALGFCAATAGLHILGAVTGYVAVHNRKGTRLLRLAGLLIAVSGTYFMLGA